MLGVLDRSLFGWQELHVESVARPVLRGQVLLLEQAHVLGIVLLEAPQLQVLVAQLNLNILILARAGGALALLVGHLKLALWLWIGLLLTLLVQQELASWLTPEPVDRLLRLQNRRCVHMAVGTGRGGVLCVRQIVRDLRDVLETVVLHTLQRPDGLDLIMRALSEVTGGSRWRCSRCLVSLEARDAVEVLVRLKLIQARQLLILGLR